MSKKNRSEVIHQGITEQDLIGVRRDPILDSDSDINDSKGPPQQTNDLATTRVKDDQS